MRSLEFSSLSKKREFKTIFRNRETGRGPDFRSRLSHLPVATDGGCDAVGAHLLPLRRVIEEDKVAEHGGESEQADAGHQDDDRVLEVKLRGPAVDDDEELEPVGLDEGAAVLLVVERVAEVPAVVVQDAELVVREAVADERPVQVAVPTNVDPWKVALDLAGTCFLHELGNSIFGGKLT